MKAIAIIIVISFNVEAQLVIEHGSTNTKIKLGSSGKQEKEGPGIGNCLASGMQNLSACIEVAQLKNKGPDGAESIYDCENSRRTFIDWWNDFKKLAKDDKMSIVIQGDFTRMGNKKRYQKRPGGRTADYEDQTEYYSSILMCIKEAASGFIKCLLEQAESLQILRASKSQHAAEVKKTQVKPLKQKSKIESIEMDIEVETLRRSSNTTYSNVTMGV